MRRKSLLQSLFGGNPSATRGRADGRRLQVERLETRELLAASPLAGVAGRPLPDLGQLLGHLLPGGGNGGSNGAETNRPPVARPDLKATTANTELKIAVSELLSNDFDRNGDTLQVTEVSKRPNTRGTVELVNGPSGGQVVFRPDAGFVGVTALNYTVSDGKGGSATGLVLVTVKPEAQATVGRIQGVGSLDGFERMFALSVRTRPNNTPPAGENPAGLLPAPDAITGQVRFGDLEQKLRFTSTTISTVEFSADGRSAKITGQGRVNGQTGYDFVVNVSDLGSRDGKDTFRIEIRKGTEFEYDSLKFAEDDGRIDRRGDIRIQAPTPVATPPAQSAALQAVLAAWEDMSATGRRRK